MKRRVCYRLKRGMGTTAIAKELGLETYQVEYIKSLNRSAVSMEFEVGDRVRLRNTEIRATIVRIFGDHVRLDNGATADFNTISYDPTPEAVEARAATVKAAHISVMRGNAIIDGTDGHGCA